MTTSYDILEWDSEFFKYKVCRINDFPRSEEESISFLAKLAEDEIRLAYYSSNEQLDFTEGISASFDILLIDRKTTFVKSLTSNSASNENIRTYIHSYPEDKLLKLSIESGVYSRFKVDEKIENERFEELYKLWIINSVNKKISKEVLVYYQEHEIAGFVTLGEKNNRADIGIIAVDSGFRGKGIGKALMVAAENWFLDEGYDSIQVVTQENNKPACGLYKSCGYDIESIENFYHLWKI